MEAVVMNAPILITGALPGQEADNPSLIVAHNLGVLCQSAASLPAIIEDLKLDGGKRLKEIRAAQRAYRNLDNANNIAKTLYELAEQKERFIPAPKRYYPVPQYARKIVRRSKSNRNRVTP
jgi:processive 1,2-diacylglycerol beta-glucosyltransferase